MRLTERMAELVEREALRSHARATMCREAQLVTDAEEVAAALEVAAGLMREQIVAQPERTVRVRRADR